MNDLIDIEIAYALPARQVIYALKIPRGSSIEQAILESPLLGEFADIDLARNKVGIFGVERKLSDCPRPGDRIEVYRELIIDPKQARLNRLAKRNKNPPL